MANTDFTPESFAAYFRQHIRVGLNWGRFFEEGWPIEAVVLDSPAALAQCFLPWYIGKAGDEVNYDFPGATPMCLPDVPKALAILNDERQADVRQIAEQFRRHAGPVEFAVPTYALPENQHFVLDRNHRLSALTLVDVPFAVTLWNVNGPLDKDCLLDLVHWLPK